METEAVELKKKQIEYVYMGFFVLFVGLIVIVNTTSIFPYNMVVIDNADPNSMYPTYTQSDIFIVVNNGPETIVLGDVIVYTSPSGKNVIHRVVDVEIIDNEYYYRVKGDNAITNYVPDTPGGVSLINYENVMGRVVLRIPQVGHFSLAIQNNPAVRSLTLVIVVLLTIAILVWPENKDEDDEEMVEISFKSIRTQLCDNYVQPVRRFFGTGRVLKILMLLFLLLLVLSPIFVTSLLSVEGEDRETGVYEVVFDRSFIQKDRIGGVDYDFVFVQTRMMAYDARGMTEEISSIRLRVFTDLTDPTTQISYTVWNSLRDMRGYFMIGGSIIIDVDDIPASGTTVFVIIEYDVRSFFTTSEQKFETSFNLTHNY